jgi:serine/threonine-protein kinase
MSDRPAAELPSIPGYTVFSELGRGGTGVVYRAHQVSLDRPVALKVLRAGLSGRDVTERFRAEAEAAARLRHTHIVQVYDAGTWEGRPYFSMELVGGGTLATRLAHRPLPPNDAARLVEALARAVQHAHEHGVVHRDLKPANVLLAADATPKIADFGLARHSEAGQGTRTGDLIGTPAYMAPEQAAGRSHRSGPAGDVYGLGAVLYECLTGRPPFQGSTVFDTLEQVQKKPAVPPRRLAPAVPRDLEAVCLKCLDKDPTLRYRSAGELADDLRRFLARRSTRATSGGMWQRARWWCRAQPVAAAVIGLLALYAAAVTAAALGLLWRGA